MHPGGPNDDHVAGYVLLLSATAIRRVLQRIGLLGLAQREQFSDTEIV